MSPPVPVLTRPDPAELPRSDETRCVQGGLAVDRKVTSLTKPCSISMFKECAASVTLL